MFDDYLIRKDSLENIYEDDIAIGFKFAVRIADYRGCFLSLVNGYYVAVDDEEFPQSSIMFEINGKQPRTFEAIKTCVWEHWDYDDEAYIHVVKKGGLTEGKHVIALQQSILAQYGYMPWDDAWILSPPIPGSGAGAGKTNTISTFQLDLMIKG